MKLRDRIRRWWRPAQWQDDHPLNADERLGEALREPHWWNEAQNVGGPDGLAHLDPTRDLRKPRT